MRQWTRWYVNISISELVPCLLAVFLWLVRVDFANEGFSETSGHDTLILPGRAGRSSPSISEENTGIGMRVISVELRRQDAGGLEAYTVIREVESLFQSASELFKTFKQYGGIDTLQETIRILRQALSKIPPNDPHRHIILDNLGIALLNYYKQTGDLDALEETICLLREGLKLCPQGHPQRGNSLNNLANALRTHYEQFGDMDELAETIALHREALVLRPYGHPHRSISLSNLAIGLATDYMQSRSIEKLNEMITLHREALMLASESHPHRGASLTNLANTLLTYYEQTGYVGALEEAIRLYHESLLLLQHGHPDRGGLLSNLADALTTYFEQTGITEKLLESITLYHEALALHAKGHPYRGALLSNLSNSYLRSFEHDENHAALLNALNVRKELLDAWPYGHPERYYAHHSLARVRLLDSPLFDWVEALNHLMQATTDSKATARQRLIHGIHSLLSVEISSARDAKRYLYSQPALDVYFEVIQLLPRVAHVGLDLSTRLRELSGSEQLCRTAAMRAMLLNQLPMAVEVFEEGKAVFWSQALRLRSDAISDLPVDDRDNLGNLFRLLEQDSNGLLGYTQDRADMENRMEYRRQLNIQADRLIEKIRLRPQFERFLKIPQYEALSHAAASGFVVALVASEPHCFAIIIQADQAPYSIILDSVNGDKLSELCVQVSGSGMRDDADRGIIKESVHAPMPLAYMWRVIVEPVIMHLGLQVCIVLLFISVLLYQPLIQKAEGRCRPRLHWYASGHFTALPLHAAGIYQGDNQSCAADFFVSSYTPSLSTLIKSQNNFTSIPRQDLQVLLFAEPNAPGLSSIPKVKDEVQVAADLFKLKSAVVANDVNAPPKVESVLEQLPSAHILHLACHGHQDKDPLKSCFALNDRPLTISSLMELNVPNAVLAYLSACQTAKGDDNQPDQAVHLAASMLFCGFRSVVATMW
jgi:tetratricopeptide (TPR) repeat protein